MATVNAVEYMLRRYTAADGTGLVGLTPTCLIGVTPGLVPTLSLAVTELTDGWYRAERTFTEPGRYAGQWETAGGAGVQYFQIDVYGAEAIPTVPGAVPLSNAALVAELQLAGIGTGLTNAQWAQVAVGAVRMYSRQRPRYALGTITTQVDVEEYDLPAGGHVCVALAPCTEADLSDLTGDTYPFGLAAAAGEVIIDFDMPSLVDIYRQKIAHWARQFGTQWRQEVPGGKVRVMSRPTTVMTLAVIYTIPHSDASTVPPGDNDLLFMAGQAVATRTMAMGAAVSVVSSGGRLTLGPYTRDTGGLGAATQILITESARLEKAFLDAAHIAAGPEIG